MVAVATHHDLGSLPNTIFTNTTAVMTTALPKYVKQKTLSPAGGCSRVITYS